MPIPRKPSLRSRIADLTALAGSLWLLVVALVHAEADPLRWTNPILPQRADPYVTFHSDGYYYLTATVPKYDLIELRRARTLAELSTAEPKVIWRKHDHGPMGAHIWAPEIHFIDGKWYVYFTAGSAENKWAIRPYVLEGTGANPLEATWTEKGPIKLGWDSFSLDGTTFEHRGTRYFVWAQAEKGVRGTNIYIARMDTPLSITGPITLLARPDHDWERRGAAVCEGPSVLIRKGRVWITYSASATNANYCLGLLAADENADLLDAASWTKYPEPVVASSPQNGQFGPGHNSFTTTPDGKTDILVYHARSYEQIVGDALANPDRAVRAQAIRWRADGFPEFGPPVADGAYSIAPPTKASTSARPGPSSVPSASPHSPSPPSHPPRASSNAVSPVEMMDASQVHLLPGSPFYERQELHRTGYVGRLDPDRLLFEYRKLAGLPQAPGMTGGYGGWDSGFIKGHMAGHYLSAASRMAATTGDDSFRKKALYLVGELAKCQEALKQDGYLAAFPSVALDWQEGTSKDSGGVVVPYYTIHKIMAGLVDAYRYLGDRQALDVALKMSAYLQKRLLALPPEQIERMFRTDRSRNPQTEFGGMADVLTELYSITGDKGQLELASLFIRPWLVTPLAANEDRLASLHANTHLAQLAGLARHANLTGDAGEVRASENAWEIITRHHSFTLGGNSYKEWFDGPDVEAGPSIDSRKCLPPTTAESCNTQNMLKLTARLIERTPDRADHADYFERALYNHLLATVAPDTGAMTYFTPLHGDFRTYLNGTHCCVGSGMENTARYSEGIYFQRSGQLWVNLYIPSTLDWAAQGLAIKQEGFPPLTDTVRLTVTRAARPAEATLFLRVPGWVSGPVEMSVNGRPQAATATPSSYLSVKRVWQTGDVVTLKLPAALRLERAKDVPSMVSVFYGPLLLTGRLGREGMPNDFADKDAYLKLPPAPVPTIVNASANPADWLTLTDASTLTFKAHDAGPASGIIFQPLYAVHHERYSVYWELTDSAIRATSASPAAPAANDTAVLDSVIIGDAESERAHDLALELSVTGHVAGHAWRDAGPDGAFSYALSLPATPKPALVCTYWGSDCDRSFDIVVNGVVVATQTLDGSHPGKTFEVAYPLPPETLTGQQNLTVAFQGTGQGRVGGLFGLRLEPSHP